ncbi:MAG TPA: NAD-dependent succinate-semialdehyde dehydrogenase [Sporichthyaceae bacterium]|nr:NAD-dependent succinate-semialdehyde dehydrogenase [Sporichthyaceae bacterium]
MSDIEVAVSRVLAAVPKQLFVDGTWRDAAGGRTFEVVDPATELTLCQVADASPGDALAALGVAAAAQARWASTAPRERGELLRRAFEAVTAARDDLALLLTLEQGKPLSEAAAEVDYAAEFFRWFAEEAVRVDGGYRRSPDGRTRLLTMRQPVGPCLFVTPWNLPLAMGTRKIGPALAAGCTVVIKPAEQTPLSVLALVAILVDCGLPPGVVNVVTSSDPAGVTNPLLADPRLRKLSFTGSTAVGRVLLARAADQVLRVSMELGGNAPFLVFGDADIEAAVDGAMIAKMRFTGQACTAANRFLVDNRVVDAFAEQLTERMAACVIGRGTEPGITVGPLIDAAAVEKVQSLVDDAVAKGARMLLGGKALPGPGHFYPPTVLADVPNSARILVEEVFGPVAPIRSFVYDAQALAEANATEFGLVAYAYTADLDRAVRVAEGLEAGMIGINRGLVSNPAAPFGGVKQSGLGREGGFEGITEFLETKYVAL